MADITDAEREAIAASVAKALSSDEPSEPRRAGAAPEAAAAGDPKEVFCKNWPLIRTGLEILQTFVPLPIRPIVALVIKAGDAAAGAICT